MLIEIIRATLSAGLIVGLATFSMVSWSLFRGYTSFDRKEKSKEKTQKKSRLKKGQEYFQDDNLETNKEKNKIKRSDFIHSKWVKFGGGYYGIVALITLGWVEFLEVWGFMSNFTSLQHFIDTISIGLIIDLIVDAVMNFVTAISWPVYWMKYIDNQSLWIWFFVTYFSYALGDRTARQHFPE